MLAAEIIRRGGLVAFPTETVYGLGANALNEAAVRRVYEAKGRPASSPLIVHVADREMACSLASHWPPLADKLAEAFWPGPLTIVVKKSVAVPDLVTAGLDSVGLRMPAHPLALQLIREAGVPIAAPSANRFMHISPTTAEHVRAGLGDRVDLILDGGPTAVGIESTVVSLARELPTVLRLGMISLSQLEDVAGIRFDVATSEHTGESPGQHPRHYAPTTPFYLLGRQDAAPAGRGRILDLSASPQQCAAELYAALHEADREGWDWIAAQELPEGPEWDAIRDRLRRAAARL
jgi:L-threonylcarbamoyladenylate synthase